MNGREVAINDNDVCYISFKCNALNAKNTCRWFVTVCNAVKLHIGIT
jgi:hypothetical protein